MIQEGWGNHGDETTKTKAAGRRWEQRISPLPSKFRKQLSYNGKMNIQAIALLGYLHSGYGTMAVP